MNTVNEPHRYKNGDCYASMMRLEMQQDESFKKLIRGGIVMKKFSSWILSIVLMLSLGVTSFAAGNDGAEIDIRKSVAPNNYNYSRSINSDGAAVAVPEATVESEFVHKIDGKEFDIRRNVAPDNYQVRKSIESDKATDQAVNQAAVADSKTTKDKSLLASMPTGGGEYPYNPSYWNDPANVFRANCYGYILNRIANDTSDPLAGYMFQPGYRTGNYYTSLTTSAIITAVKSDMADLGRTIRSSSYSETPGSNEYKVALVIAPGTDYHWYRQDSDGGWSHKPGLTNIDYRDASGNYISDPRTCDRNYSYANYSTWGGYYIISK